MVLLSLAPLFFTEKDGDVMAEFKSQDEKTKQAFSMIEQGVRDVYSSELFKQYLSCLSKFHSYSLNNTLLILSQKPEASLVAGYRAWQTNFNRHVNKGEKGLTILAPVTTKEDRLMNKHDENGNVILDESGNPIQEMRVVNLTHFKTTTVFDISQTSGDPLPSLVHDLTGSSNEVKAIIQTIQSVCTIPIEFKTETEDLSFMTGAKGYYSPRKDKIVINKDLENLQTAKTLIHEYAHSILHKETDKNQSQREIEAESLAFVICDHFGIDTSEYSFGYIASYANKDYSELKSILVNIQSKAHEMIELIEPVFKENLHMLEKENQYITPVEMEELNHDIVLKVASVMEKYKEIVSDSNITTSDIHETIDQEISNLLTDNKEYRVQDHLYQNNEVYQRVLHSACYDAFMNEEFDPKQSWFMDHSIERRNYEIFEKIASPLLTNSAYYMKYGTSNYMDLNIEIIGDDRLAMAHNYVLNGDVMADPDVEFTVDKKNRMLYPQTYQQDSLQYFERVDGDSNRARELNHFMHEWLTNVVDQKYKVQTIYTEDKELSVKENPNAVRSFCKQNGIGMVAPKLKELEK